MLSNTEIRLEMKNGNIVIEPFSESQLGANSYDLCLGNWFVDLLGYENQKPVYSDFFFIPDGTEIAVPIGGTMLAMTKEVAGSKYDLVPSLKTRSTIRRKGVDICASAGLGDIGYINHWTIELTSLARLCDWFTEPYLIVGERIGQIHFDRAGLPADPPYQGQYNSTEWPLCMLPKESRSEYGIKDGDFIRSFNRHSNPPSWK